MSQTGTSRSPYGRPEAFARRCGDGARRLASAMSGGVFGAVLWMGIATGTAMGLSGCAAKPPPPPVVTPVVMTLIGGPDVNPDARGRASPLTARVYALKTSGAFDAADFFSLFEKDQATLGAEMVQREELLLRPGDSKKLEMTLAPDVKAIAVMAAYRDLDRARWREVRVLEVGKINSFTLTFGARQIQIEARAEPRPEPKN